MENTSSSQGLPIARILMILAALLIILLAFHLLSIWSVRDGPGTGRIWCAAHLSGIGKALHTYASDGNQGMPIALHLLATMPGAGPVRYAPGMIGKHRDVHASATRPADETAPEMSTTRNLWMLIRAGGSMPVGFICPDSNDQANDEDNPQEYWDFRKYSEISYGYQVPYGKLGKPVAEGDLRTVLAADKGPYSAALEAGKPNPGVPRPGLKAPAKDWQSWNSPNHMGEGQNVLYADSHVDWANTPLAGVKNDNIYTRWSDPTGGTDADPTPRIHGTPPTGIETPFADTDSLIYP